MVVIISSYDNKYRTLTHRANIYSQNMVCSMSNALARPTYIDTIELLSRQITLLWFLKGKLETCLAI